jgi:hypothetical protein
VLPTLCHGCMCLRGLQEVQGDAVDILGSRLVEGDEGNLILSNG